MIFTPFLVWIAFSFLGFYKINSIKTQIKELGVFWVLPVPLIALLQRMLRSNSDMTIGFRFFEYKLWEHAILPLAMFLFLFYLSKMRVKANLINMKGTSKTLLYEKNKNLENIIFVPLMNVFCLTLVDIIMNNKFFFWFDIFLIPLVRISIALVIIILGMNYYFNTKRLQSKKNNLLIGGRYIFAFILWGLIVSGMLSYARYGMNILVVLLILCIVVFPAVGIIYMSHIRQKRLIKLASIENRKLQVLEITG